MNRDRAGSRCCFAAPTLDPGATCGGRCCFAVPLLLYVFLALAAAWPFSIQPGRFFPVNRTAAKHAVTMYHLGEYCRDGSRPTAFLDIWNFPEGGIARPQGVPSLAMGWLLCRALPPRLAFNLLVIFNLVLSALAFFLLGRRMGFSAVPAAALGTLAGFHPVMQSFVQRGQVENTALWPAGFALLALAAVIRDQRPRPLAIAAAILLPVVTLFSTAYYALFLLLSLPLLMIFLMVRERVGWRDPAVHRAGAVLLAAALLTLAGAQFYRPGGAPGTLPNLHPNTLQLGLAGVTPASSLADLVNPAEFMAQEKPYLGLSLLLCLLPAAAFLLWRKRMRWEPAVLLGGTVLFGLLAAGRSVGTIPLPAALLDLVIPDFRLFTMLVRALPFLALFGGLVVALAVERLPVRWARAALASLVLLTLADQLAVNPPAARLQPNTLFDAPRDLDPVIRSLPRFAEADLPLADLPPPAGRLKFLWNRYTYFQTEHLQKIAWSDSVPDPLRDFPALLGDLCERPEEYAGDRGKLDKWAAAVRRSGLRLVVLHKEFVSQDQAVLLSSLLDTVFLRAGESARVAAWAVAGEAPSPRASTEGSGTETQGT